MRIEVDRDRCIGSGNCSFYAGSTFDLDDDLKVKVLAGAEHGEGDAVSDIRAAAEGCPVKAITVHDPPGETPDQRED
jgi:ferredoxin